MNRVLVLIVSFVLSSFAMSSEVQTVSYVDVSRYMGDWYEIARIDNSFQKNCGATKVNYQLSGSAVKVTNRCINKRNQKVDTANALARVVDTKTNAKLSVSFVPFFNQFGLFGGDYWIMDIDYDYQYALVGHPTRNYLWIISRKSTLDEGTYAYLLNVARSNGYDLTRIKKTAVWNL